jgi:hypothetical protein
MALVLAGVVAKGAGAEPAVLLGFITADTSMAVQHAVAGATNRLGHPECQRVFADFSFAVPSAAQFAPVRFFDDRDAPLCRAGSSILAFTSPGSRIVHVCGRRFLDAFRDNPTTAEIIVIHEFLHVLGLGENPPKSQVITAQVAARCAR